MATALWCKTPEINWDATDFRDELANLKQVQQKYGSDLRNMQHRKWTTG